jgi:hypothetical protein
MPYPFLYPLYPLLGKKSSPLLEVAPITPKKENLAPLSQASDEQIV